MSALGALAGGAASSTMVLPRNASSTDTSICTGARASAFTYTVAAGRLLNARTSTTDVPL